MMDDKNDLRSFYDVEDSSFGVEIMFCVMDFLLFDNLRVIKNQSNYDSVWSFGCEDSYFDG